MSLGPADVERFAVAASAAYDTEVAIRERLASYGLRLIGTFADAETDSFVFAAGDTDTLVFGFRGTDSLRDAMIDAEVAVSDFGGARFAGARPLVHDGFRGCWRALRDWCDTQSQVNASWPRRVVVTGHSLGGAIATLAACDLWALAPISAYTYGSPRVGLSGFVSAYSKAVPETVRVVNDMDIVPRVPGFNYAHVCDPLRLDSRGRVVGSVRGWFRDLVGFPARLLADLDAEALRDHHVANYVDVCQAYARAPVR